MNMVERTMNDSYRLSREMTIQEKAGQLFFPAAFINDSDRNIQALEELITNYSIGGLTFFHSREMAATNYEKRKDISRNEQSYERLKALIEHYQSIAKHPLLISIDAEWGLAMRVENTEQYPYALTLGALDDPDLVCQVGQAIGNDLLNTGVHLNLAPVLDVNDNPSNPVIGYRSFGEDKYKVVALALAYFRGMRSSGVLGCAKHFPGHGNTAIDSHISLPIIRKSEQELAEQELYPFTKAIAAGIDLVMPGHLAVPALTGTDEPASLSYQMITTWLRQRLGFEGAIMTDALNMHAVSEMFEKPGELELAAFNAGNDILSFSQHIPEAINQIFNKAQPERIEASFRRIELLKMKCGLHDNRRMDLSQPRTPKECIDLRLKLAEGIITEIKAGDCLSKEISDKMACILVNRESVDNPFLESLSEYREMPVYELSKYDPEVAKKMLSSLTRYDTLIVALYVPKVKPMNQFGLTNELLSWINELLVLSKVHLVVFGNPYSLDFINFSSAQRCILAYQDFSEFEKTAISVLFGQLKTRGSLPVSLRQPKRA